MAPAPHNVNKTPAEGQAATTAARPLLAQIVHVKLTWPAGSDLPEHAAEFSITVDQALSLFLDKKIVAAADDVDISKTPTPRLRKAMKDTEGIESARYPTAFDLFHALAAAKV